MNKMHDKLLFWLSVIARYVLFIVYNLIEREKNKKNSTALKKQI